MEVRKLMIMFFLLVLPKLHIKAEILPLYTDEGIPSNANIFCWSANQQGIFDGDYQQLSVVAEGTKCFKTVSNPAWMGGWWENWAGWGIFYPTAQNFSIYTNGELRFWINTTTSQVKIEIQQANNIKGTKWLKDLGWTESYLNQWVLVRAPLNDFGVDLSSITGAFIITADLNGESSTSATFYVDLVRWVTADVNLPHFSIKIKDNQTHVEKSSITFNVNLQQSPGWTVANEYIELELDPDNIHWGIQIYTDNKSDTADPKYTGDDNPAGLVDTTDHTKVLPMGWTIVDSTKTYTQLGNGTPGSYVSDGFLWKWMKDKNTEGFQNGEDYITLWDNKGLLRNTTNRISRNSPNYIYLSANFSTALSGRIYRTNQIKIEFYYK